MKANSKSGVYAPIFIYTAVVLIFLVAHFSFSGDPLAGMVSYAYGTKIVAFGKKTSGLVMLIMVGASLSLSFFCATIGMASSIHNYRLEQRTLGRKKRRIGAPH